MSFRRPSPTILGHPTMYCTLLKICRGVFKMDNGTKQQLISKSFLLGDDYANEDYLLRSKVKQSKNQILHYFTHIQRSLLATSVKTELTLSAVYHGCAEVMGCFGCTATNCYGNTDGCLGSKDCQIGLNYWVDSRNRLYMRLFGKTSELGTPPYIAVGISNDKDMVCEHFYH